MKPKFYSFILSLFFAAPVLAQLPNSGFENWAGGMPDGWFSADTSYISQSTTAHGGTSAVRLPVVTLSGYNFAGALATGNPNNAFFYCNCRPEAVRFWYIFNGVGNDQLSLLVGGYNQDMTFGAAGSFYTSASTAVYKEGGANMVYNKAGNADSMSVIFSITPGSSGYSTGTYAILDDVSFGPAFIGTGINEQLAGSEVVLEKVQPNPVTTQANIIYTLSAATPVSLEVYNITGRLVKTLVNGKQTPGRYKAILDVTDMPAGTYFYRLTASGNTVADKLCVVR